MKRIGILLASVLVCLLLLSPTAVEATAGGHGGGHSSGGHSSGGSSSHSTSVGGHSTSYGNGLYSRRSSPLVWVFLAVSIGLVGFRRLRQQQQTKAQELATYRSMLKEIPGTKRKKDRIREDITTSFLAIQQAWDVQQPKQAAAFCTERLLAQQQQALAAQQDEGVVNHTRQVKVQGLQNFRHVEAESFSVDIAFSCVDYLEDLEGQLLAGQQKRRQQFLQKWFFDYDTETNRWRADFIQPLFLT